MEKFINDNFLLTNKTSEILYHEYAKKMPICDCHNHLSCKEIYENNNFNNIGQAWLEFDHYKWRIMRNIGIEEKYITGEASYAEKFNKFCEAMPKFIGNPVYHWSYLELKRFFDIDMHIDGNNAKEIFDKCNTKLSQEEYKPRKLIEKSNVKILCTTDSPLDNLEYHKKLKDSDFKTKVLPSFRPDEFFNVAHMDTIYNSIMKLQEITDLKIDNYQLFIKALYKRIEYFKELGCLMSDHGLEQFQFNLSLDIEEIFNKIINQKELNIEEKSCYQTNFLIDLSKKYYEENIVMQLHIGPLRNVNKFMFNQLGKDVGNDSMNDFNVAEHIASLLNEINQEDKMPKMILYCLNPKDNYSLASMIGNFKDKVQFGPAWWFNDNFKGMINHLDTLSSYGLISNFMGMLTDSRSILSMTRHEYFRRILCDYLGKMYENKEINEDIETLGKIVEDICFNNVMKFIGGTCDD